MANKKNLTAEDIEEAANLYSGGMTCAEVAKSLGFNFREVRVSLGDMGVLRKSGFRVCWVGDSHIRCSKCDTVKPLDEIVYNTNNSHHASGNYLSYCKACRATQQAASREGKPIPWGTRYSRLASRCRKDGTKMELEVSDLERLWTAQKGICIFTNEKMIDAQGYGKNPLSVSIDKVMPEYGYVKGNVVLCTTRANSIKFNQTIQELEEWMPLWYSRLMEKKDIWQTAN